MSVFNVSAGIESVSKCKNLFLNYRTSQQSEITGKDINFPINFLMNMIEETLRR